MRIAFYVPRPSLLDLELARGGDPVFLHGLFSALRARGHDIEVASRFDVGDVWRGHTRLRELIRETIAVRTRMKRFSPDAWLVYNASRTYPDPFGWWQRTSRYVLLGAQSWQSAKVPRRWRWILSFVHRRSLRRADAVTVIRRATGKRLQRQGVDQRRLRILPPAARLVDDVPSQREARLRLGLRVDAPIILTAARFTSAQQRKQGKTEMILDLLTALAALPPDVELLVVGDGPGRSRIEAEADRLQLDGRVHLVGAVDNAAMQWFFAACDVYAYPYPRDIPSVSVLEAQGSGRPVVAMRTESTELTVDAPRSGLLAATLQEFTGHLDALTRDRNHAAEMGRAARAFVREVHSTDLRARQIEELLTGPPTKSKTTPIGET